MRMRRIALSVIALSLLSPAYAEGGAKREAGLDAPRADVERVESAYRSISDFEARFEQTTDVALLERSIAKTGTLRFKKGGRWRIDYDGKGGKSYVSDGTTLWVFARGDEASLSTYAVNDETVPREALSFLSGFASLAREFRVYRSQAFPPAGGGEIALLLLPKGGKRHYERMDALFGADGMPLELIVRNTSGNVTRYRFSAIRTNQGLPDSLFTLSSGKATPDTLPE